MLFALCCFVCNSGGGVAASSAGAAEERSRAERRVVPEFVTGDGESEKQAGHCFCPMSDSRNPGDVRLIL